MTDELHFPDWSNFGPKMLLLRERERRFVWAYLMNALHDGKQNGAQAARDAGFPNSSEAAKVRAHELLHRDDVLDAISETAGRELRGLAIPAVVALSKLVRNSDHPDHRKSVEMVLNRVGHGERTAVDVTVGGTVTVNHTDEAIGQLRMLKALDVPRSKLEEIFGHTGLPRYERMLEEVDRRVPKLIEHEAARD